MRYFFELSYIGTHYHGWQRQPNVPSVQQTIEEALSKMLGTKMSIVGCGRTDAGVHAKQFYAHFRQSDNVEIQDFSYDPVFRMNKILPSDIAIKDMVPVPKDVHAQYSAKARTYEYHFHTTKNPFLATTSALYDDNSIDIELITKALELILAQTDFRLFCKSPDQYKHTLCNIMDYQLEKLSPEVFQVRIKSNRFLQSMIRLIMARSLDVGMRKINLEELKKRIDGQVPFERKYMAHPQGLMLTKIEYDYFTSELK